jgi:hypothetical protein
LTTFLEPSLVGPDSHFLHDLWSVYFTTDPHLVASMLHGVMVGVSRRLL